MVIAMIYHVTQLSYPIMSKVSAPVMIMRVISGMIPYLFLGYYMCITKFMIYYIQLPTKFHDSSSLAIKCNSIQF